MRTGFICAAGIVMAAVLAAGGIAAKKTNQEQRRNALERLERQWLENESNPAVLRGILGDDFVHVLPAGLISKSEQLAYLRRKKAAPGGNGKNFEFLKIRIYGDTGIANGVVAQTDSHGNTERRTAFTDVFVLRNGEWQAVNAQETPLEAEKTQPVRVP